MSPIGAADPTEDTEQLHEIFSDPETHTIGDGAYTDIEKTRELLRRRELCWQRHGLAWHGVRLADGTLIGNAGLFFGRTGTEPEMGFEIRVRRQGRGYGGRAAGAVLEEAHRVGVRRVWATVRPSNAASLYALARLGFVENRIEEDERGALVYLVPERAIGSSY